MIRSISKKLNNKFNDLSMGKKLFISFGMLGVLFIGTVWIYQSTISNVLYDYSTYLKELEDLKVQNLRIRTYLLEARMHEKNFLLHKDLESANKVNSIVSMMKKEAAEIKARETILRNFDEVHAVENLIKNIVSYHNKFQAVVKTIKKNGLDNNSGLQGKFKEAAYKLETFVSKASLSGIMDNYLVLRQNEKDYLIQLDMAYVEEVDKLLSIIKKKSGALHMTADQKDTLKTLLTQYKDRFHGLVDTSITIKPLVDEMDKAAYMIEPLIMDNVKKVGGKGTINIGSLSDRSQENATIALIIASTAVCIGVLLALIITGSISKPIVMLKAAIERFSQGDMLDLQVEIPSKDEIGQLTRSFEKMTKDLHAKTTENEKQYWLKTGQAELNKRMSGQQDISSLASEIMNFISPYLDAQIGAIYIADDDNILRMAGSYAYTKRKNLPNEFKFGESLVGQAALKKQHILLNNVPDDYIKINSGLGEANPHNILVVPFMFEGQVKGVVEIGSFGALTDLQTEFVDSITDAIGIAYNTVISNRTKELLEQSQAMAEELQAQQGELKAANEELEDRSKLLEKQKGEILQKNIKLQEAQLLLEEKAKQLNVTSKYKSEFLANMSHELRTPLNSMLILSQYLFQNKGGNLTKKQVEYAKTIQSSGKDLLTLINDILDLSKVESGKMEIYLEDVPLTNFFTPVKQDIVPLTEEKGVKLEMNLMQGLPESIHTDFLRVNQIIKNLLSNAIKFTPEGGNITLSIFRPNQEVDLSNTRLNPEKTLAFSVFDTGKGIPKNKHEIVFEAFKQAEGSTTRKHGGTGLGLSYSREIARLLGGVIKLQSEEGKGSTFTFYLPEVISETKDDPTPVELFGQDNLKPGKVAPQKHPREIPDDRRKIKPNDKSILIIEDDRNFERILLDFAHEKGFKCILADTGETGLQFADYYKPKAIILDIFLPGIDGWTVIERLKENPNTRNIPVYFISASDENIEALNMGAIGCLTKPVSKEMLDDAFEKIEDTISQKPKKLLLVEDDKKQKKEILSVINNTGIETTMVSGGKEAYKLLKSGKFDSMIINPGLTDNSGFDLLGKIKSDKTINPPPIIIYSRKEISTKEKVRLQKYKETLVIREAKSPEKLLGEMVLYLHLAESSLDKKQRKLLSNIYDSEAVLRNKKILMVDDDVRNLFALSSILEDKGAQVSVAKNGKECLTYLDKNPDIDLILMDIMMPEMDGYEASTKIREQDRFKDLPIIAITAKAMKGDKAKCIEAGASDYLAKPVNMDRLFSLLRVWLYK